MKDIMKEDKIMQIDFDSAFPETPSAIHEAVKRARMDIVRYERRRRFFKTVVTAAAACLVVIAGAAVFMMRGTGNNSDIITPPVLSQDDIAIDMETPVFASRTDPYYHSAMDCPSAYPESVELPLVTAIEFEKAACPACASHLNAGDRFDDVSAEQKTGNSLQPRRIVSEGAVEALEDLVQSGAKPVYDASFFGGSLKVYAARDGGYICSTDPTPSDEIFYYALIGRNEISAEAYYALFNGTGEYADYNAEGKYLVASWGDYYDAHIYYETLMQVEIVDNSTGACAWRMTQDQYDAFVKDGSLTMTASAGAFQPGLQALLEQNNI